MVVNFICPLRVSLFKKRNRQHESLIAFQKINFDIIKNCSCWCHRPGGGFQYRLAIVAIKSRVKQIKDQYLVQEKPEHSLVNFQTNPVFAAVNQSISSTKAPNYLAVGDAGNFIPLEKRMSYEFARKQFKNFIRADVAGNQTITGIFPVEFRTDLRHWG